MACNLSAFLISFKDANAKKKASYFCLLETVRGILTGFFFSTRERFYFGKENCAKFWPTENEFAALNFYELVKVSLRDLYSSWCWDGRRALPETPDEKSSPDGRDFGETCLKWSADIRDELLHKIHISVIKNLSRAQKNIFFLWERESDCVYLRKLFEWR